MTQSEHHAASGKHSRKPQGPRRSARRPIRRVLIGLGGFLAVLVGLAVLAGSGPVLRALTPWVNDLVSDAIGGEFELGRIEGSLWTGLRLDRFVMVMPHVEQPVMEQPVMEQAATGQADTVLSDGGLQIDLADFVFDWAPFELLTGELHVTRLSAARTNVILPQGGPADTVEEDTEPTGGFVLPVTVALDRLALDQVTVVDPLTGKSFIYEFDAAARLGRDFSAKLQANLTPLDGGTDRLVADLDFDGAAQRLRAEIDGMLDRSGLVMTLAGLAPDTAPSVQLSLSGDGPADNWKGGLDFSASDLGRLTADIGINLAADRVDFSLDGTAAPLGDLAETLPEPLRGDIVLGLGGQFNGDGQQVTLNRVTVAKDRALSLNGMAQLDLVENTVLADLGADIDPAIAELIDNQVTWQGLRLDARAKGPLELPAVDVTLIGRDVATPVSRIAGLSLSAKAVSADAGGDVIADARLELDGNDWRDDDLGAMLGRTLDVSFSSRIASGFAQFSLSDLLIETPEMTVRGTAELNDAGQVAKAMLTGDVSDLAVFAPISGLDLSGRGKVTVDQLVWSPEDGGRADVAIAASDLGFGIGDLDRIVGSAPTIDGRVEVSPAFDLNIAVSQITTAMITGPADIGITDNFDRLKVASSLVLAPGTVPPDIGVSIQPATLDIVLDGPMAAPSGTIDLATASVEAAGQQFADMRLNTRMQWSEQSVLSLRNRAQFGFSGRDYTLAADLFLPDDRLRIEAISLQGADIDLRGAIELPGYAVPLRGRVTLDRLNAALLADFGVPIGNGQIIADVDFIADREMQRIDVTSSLSGIRMTGGANESPPRIEDVTISGVINNAFAEPAIDLRLDGRDIVSSAAVIEKLVVAVTGELEKLSIATMANGSLPGAIPVLLDSRMQVGLGDDLTLRADRLDAEIGSQKIALNRPLQAAQTAAGAQMLDADMSVGSGTLRAVFDMTPDRSASGNAAIEGVALGPWGEMFGVSGLTGTANITASLREQAGRNVQASLKGAIENITAKAARGLDPFVMDVDATLTDGVLDAGLEFGNDNNRVVMAKGRLPLDISILKQDFAPDMSAPLAAQLRVDGEIAEFWPYVPAPDHVLSGGIKLNLDVGGTLDDIVWKGDLAMNDGVYEHLEYGTILRQIAFAGDFDQNGLSIPSITATDGGNGRLDGAVKVALEDANLDYDAEFQLRNMALARKDELQVWADVDAAVTGNQENADIQSNVTVQRGEVDLTLALPETVPQLDVQNLQDTPEEQTSAQKAAVKQTAVGDDAPGFVGDLDVTVNIPGRLFVRGKGLDSEWGGTLKIGGTTAEPAITGQLQALRGQLDVIGKTFVIKDSKITFSGANPPDPLLDIKGVYTTAELTVTAGFSGPSSDPELTLSSQPSLPEDEILSQVLFGKSQGNLSAIEAVQLASAVNELSGGGSGLDVVGSIRRFIGADVLRVGGGEEGPNVKVGKYLTEGVYVGTKAGSTPGSSGVEVEIEVTPHISVTSETTEIDSKAGVQYHLDY